MKKIDDQLLSFISILHQTTTPGSRLLATRYCLLSLFYIKPQHTVILTFQACHCLLSLFYIKPQQLRGWEEGLTIIFYLYSTSNHNLYQGEEITMLIVFYLYSTSNHNVYFLIFLFTDICVHSYVHEVVKTYYLLCKITKKILTAMGSALIFSLWLPKCE